MERKSKATIRKAAKRGEITQKMMTFRLDAVLIEKLEKEANKGRLINQLLKQHYGIKEADG